MSKKDRPKITGTTSYGTPPPPGAPRETGDAATGAEAQRALLRERGGNERELAPWNPPKAPGVVLTTVVAAPPSARGGEGSEVGPPAVGVDTPTVPVPSSSSSSSPALPALEGEADAATSPSDSSPTATTDAVVRTAAEGEGRVEAETPASDPSADSSPAAETSAPPPTVSAAQAQDLRKTHPAASDSDSPSRGIPQQIQDRGKQITGGFGDVLEAQYFPLDGSELKALVQALLDDLYVRIQHDLRFSPAVTYPRVRAKVEIVVEGWAEDASQAIVAYAPVQEKTPVEAARMVSDEIAFVVVSQREEFREDGEISTTTNAMREELGLAIPQKQRVSTPGGPMIVDVVEEQGGR